MRVGGVTGATGELFNASGADKDGVGNSSFSFYQLFPSYVPSNLEYLNLTEARSIKRAHVEDVDTLHLSENFETLETGRLLEVGRDLTGEGTRTEEIGRGLHLCNVTI